jgi:predicted RNA-binding protein associated with RNAse of E/G family
MKKEQVKHLKNSSSKLHLRYIRLPDRVSEYYDELVFRSEKVMVGRSRITPTHPVAVEGEVVMGHGFEMTYFCLMGKWFDVCKIRNPLGKRTGYYCDIATPPKLLEDGGIEMTDLFLDLWVFPNLAYRILDEDELRHALQRELVTKELHDKAKKELDKLVKAVEDGQFPPREVKKLEAKLNL